MTASGILSPFFLTRYAFAYYCYCLKASICILNLYAIVVKGFLAFAHILVLIRF